MDEQVTQVTQVTEIATNFLEHKDCLRGEVSTLSQVEPGHCYILARLGPTFGEDIRLRKRRDGVAWLMAWCFLYNQPEEIISLDHITPGLFAVFYSPFNVKCMTLEQVVEKYGHFVISGTYYRVLKGAPERPGLINGKRTDSKGREHSSDGIPSYVSFYDNVSRNVQTTRTCKHGKMQSYGAVPCLRIKDYTESWHTETWEWRNSKGQLHNVFGPAYIKRTGAISELKFFVNGKLYGEYVEQYGRRVYTSSKDAYSKYVLSKTNGSKIAEYLLSKTTDDGQPLGVYTTYLNEDYKLIYLDYENTSNVQVFYKEELIPKFILPYDSSLEEVCKDFDLSELPLRYNPTLPLGKFFFMSSVSRPGFSQRYLYFNPPEAGHDSEINILFVNDPGKVHSHIHSWEKYKVFDPAKLMCQKYMPCVRTEIGVIGIKLVINEKNEKSLYAEIPSEFMQAWKLMKTLELKLEEVVKTKNPKW